MDELEKLLMGIGPGETGEITIEGLT